MKHLDWDEEKNRKLKDERGMGFQDVRLAIEGGKLIDTYNHPNQKRYPGQKIMVIEVNNYAYLVPYIEDEKKFFLKTIIPNRKATKKYLRNK